MKKLKNALDRLILISSDITDYMIKLVPLFIIVVAACVILGAVCHDISGKGKQKHESAK